MCARNDQPIDFCSAFPGPEQISYTPELASTLSRINTEVNARYNFQSDSGSYGLKEYWTVPTGTTADCDDYVLAKIWRLHDEGVAVSALVILIGPLANGRWHSTLGVRTDSGLVVLDSLHRSTTTVERIGMDVAFYKTMDAVRRRMQERGRY